MTVETSRHLGWEELERALHALPDPPRDLGRVALVVARPSEGERLTPEPGRLTPEAGLEGDRWSLRPNPDADGQVSVMRADAARVFANSQSLALFGDNLLLELDLSRENLPAGTRLRIGTALCEVTPKPHTGCGKFAARFGQEARQLTGDPAWADQRLRGIFVRVLEAGEVAPGDAVEVLSRPGA